MKAMYLSMLLAICAITAKAQESESFLNIGDPAPSFEVMLSDSSFFKTDSVLQSGRSIVLIFYRGTWCPYCNRYLSELAEEQEAIEKAGGIMLAVSPETTAYQESMKESTEAGFHFAHDADYFIMSSYAVAFEAPDKLIKKQMKKGNDLLASHGTEDEFVLLPVPATVVIAPNNEIVYFHYDTNYKERAEVSDILHALEIASSLEQ